MSALFAYVIYSIVAIAGYWLLVRADTARRLALIAPAASLVVGWVTWRFTSDWLFGDFFQAYWPAGAALLGDTPSLRALTTQGVRGFVNLPIVAVLFVPFAWMDAWPAAWVFTAFGVVATLAAWWALARVARLEEAARWRLLYLFAANGPLIYSLEFGNTSHLVLLALALALLCWRTRPVVAGVLLGAVTLVKLPLVLLAGYLLVRRQWAVLGGLLALLGGAVAASLAAFGWDLHVLWYRESVAPFLGGSIPAYNVQTIPGFLARVQTGGSGLRLWEPVALTPLSRVLALGLSAGLLLLGLWPNTARRASQARPAEDPLALELSCALVFCVVAGSLAWSHYYAWMLVPIALLLGHPAAAADKVTRRLAIAGTWLVSLPVFPVYLEDGAFKDAFTRTAASYLLLGGVLLFAALVRVRMQAGSPYGPSRSAARTARRRS